LVTSVSFSPQSLLVFINKDSSFHEILSKGCKLSLSFLNSNQSNIAKICSIDNERFNNNFWNFDDDEEESSDEKELKKGLSRQELSTINNQVTKQAVTIIYIFRSY